MRSKEKEAATTAHAGGIDGVRLLNPTYSEVLMDGKPYSLNLTTCSLTPGAPSIHLRAPNIINGGIVGDQVCYVRQPDTMLWM